MIIWCVWVTSSGGPSSSPQTDPVPPQPHLVSVDGWGTVRVNVETAGTPVFSSDSVSDSPLHDRVSRLIKLLIREPDVLPKTHQPVILVTKRGGGEGAVSHPPLLDHRHDPGEQPDVPGEGVFVQHGRWCGGVTRLTLVLVPSHDHGGVPHVIAQQPVESLPPVLSKLDAVLTEHHFGVTRVPLCSLDQCGSLAQHRGCTLCPVGQDALLLAEKTSSPADQNRPAGKSLEWSPSVHQQQPAVRPKKPTDNTELSAWILMYNVIIRIWHLKMHLDLL